MSLLHRWIISNCMDRGREPPAFVRRRIEQDPALQTYAERLARLDDRLREDLPDLPEERRVAFDGVPFSRADCEADSVIGRVGTPWRLGAGIAAVVVICVLVAIAVRSTPTAPPEAPSGYKLASEIQDLRADASLLSRRILEHLPKRPRLGQRLDGEAEPSRDAG